MEFSRKKQRYNVLIIPQLQPIFICIFLQTTYFIARDKGNPGGKLYSRINYLRQSNRKREREEDEYLSGVQISKPTQLEIPHQAVSALEWLQLNHSPWPTVLSQWEQSFAARKADLRKQNQSAKILQAFPHLFVEHGYQLVRI